MNIAVILKQVPDTEANILIDSTDTSKIQEDDIKFVLNPYDEHAVEEALRIADQTEGEVIGVCIGLKRSETAIRSAMAMGIHRAVFISDPEAVEADILTQAKILAAAIKTLDVSLILCGREWIDLQDEALAASVAEYLKIPHVLNIGNLSADNDKIVATREMDGGSIEIESSLPAVVSCSKDLNEPRYPTLIAIRRAKKKELVNMPLADLNVDIGSPKSRLATFLAPPKRSAGKKISGEPQDVAEQAVTWLTEEAKVF